MEMTGGLLKMSKNKNKSIKTGLYRNLAPGDKFIYNHSEYVRCDNKAGYSCRLRDGKLIRFNMSDIIINLNSNNNKDNNNKYEDEDNNIINIEFVKYTGRYPNLCSGTLTLKINNKLITFGNEYDRDAKLITDYKSFWRTGGEINWHTGYCNRSKWIIDKEDLPDCYKEYYKEFDKVFNDNVEHGCCGGCI